MAVGTDITERLLVDAGITKGMRVLDIGCGSGDTTLLLAQMVGSTGSVVGVDHEPRVLATARMRAQQQDLHNISFVDCNLYALPFDNNVFDAVFGRRVLMYLPDPIGAFNEIAQCLRPGGLVIFQEHDRTMSPGCLVPMPLHEQVYHWIWRTVEKEGGNPHMGFELHSDLSAVGFEVQNLRVEAVVQTPTAPYPYADIVRAVLPRMIAQGVVSAEEVGMDTLEQRLAEERKETGATLISDLVFCIWARKSHASF